MNLNLTPREQEVVHLSLMGLTDAEVAEALDISQSTVSTYWERIRAKLGAKNRMHVVGIISGFVNPD